jgi:hypothetical protein
MTDRDYGYLVTGTTITLHASDLVPICTYPFTPEDA